MDLGLGFLRGLYAFVLSCCLVFCLRRLLWARRKRQGKRNLGFFPTYTSAGNALQALQAIAQPRADYVLAEKFVDEADDDDEESQTVPKNICIANSDELDGERRSSD